MKLLRYSQVMEHIIQKLFQKTNFNLIDSDFKAHI